MLPKSCYRRVIVDPNGSIYYLVRARIIAHRYLDMTYFLMNALCIEAVCGPADTAQAKIMCVVRKDLKHYRVWNSSRIGHEALT